MSQSGTSTFRRQTVKFVAVAGVALTLAIGGGQAASAQEPAGQEQECQADRSDHLLGGLLTGPLTFVSDVLPFTIAGEQFPVCE